MAPPPYKSKTAQFAKDFLSERLGLCTPGPAITGRGVKSLRRKANSFEPITCVGKSGNSILDCSPLHIENGHIVDGQGRRRTLKGINVDSSSKAPVKPFMPSYEGDSSQSSNVFFDGENVSFVGRPFPLEVAEAHLERIKSWGYNTIRYLVCWEALEHKGPGIYDEEYIDYTVEILRIIHRVGGLYVFLECHQDTWSRFSGGSGAPLWTFHAAGLQPTRFDVTEAAILHNSDQFPPQSRSDPDCYPKMLWTSNYKRLASLTMFTLFFAGDTYFPHLKINGVNIQHYLQQHHFNSLKRMWEAVVERLPEMFENGSMLGFESLNEPNCGVIGTPDLSCIPAYQQLRIGTTPSVYDCFRLGMGFPVTVDNYKISITGPQKNGRVVVDPRGQRAWMTAGEMASVDKKHSWERSGWTPHECIFAELGVWKWKDVDLNRINDSAQTNRLEFSSQCCKLLKPTYFSDIFATISYNVPDERLPRKIDHTFFVNHFFVEFYVKFREMVREVAPDVFVLLQPPVLEVPPSLKDDPRGIIDNKTIYCPHYYDGMSLMFKSWNTRYNVDTFGIMRNRYLNPVLGIVFGEKAIRNCIKRQFVEITKECQEHLGNIPVLMSETGMPFDMDGKKSYEDGKYQSQTAALDALANALEGAGMHHTYWCYTSINCHKWGDRWNNEDFSFWSPDDRDLTFEDDPHESTISPPSSRGSALSASITAIKEKDTSALLDLLKISSNYSKKRVLKTVCNQLSSDCQVDTSGAVLDLDDSSLISLTSTNLRYRHLRKCYPSPDGVRAVSAVIRPFLVATVGSVKESEFDIKSSKFILCIKIDPQLPSRVLQSTPTIIFLPKWHYPYLNYNDIYLNVGSVKYDEANEYLEWYHYDCDEIEAKLKRNPEGLEHILVVKNNSGKNHESYPQDMNYDCN